MIKNQKSTKKLEAKTDALKMLGRLNDVQLKLMLTFAHEVPLSFSSNENNEEDLAKNRKSAEMILCFVKCINIMFDYVILPRDYSDSGMQLFNDTFGELEKMGKNINTIRRLIDEYN